MAECVHRWVQVYLQMDLFRPAQSDVWTAGATNSSNKLRDAPCTRPILPAEDAPRGLTSRRKTLRWRRLGYLCRDALLRALPGRYLVS